MCSIDQEAMPQISIPDPLYVEAQRVADANGVSLERFIREAVQLHRHDEPELGTLRLTTEQVVLIRQSQADIKAGKGIPIEQIKAELIANRATWPQTGQR